MNAKDVALLGFVSAAQEYVDKHINDGSNLGELKNINIKFLREELFKQLKFYSGSKEEIKTLIEQGEEAFEEYRKENLSKNTFNIVNLLGDTYKVDNEDNIEDKLVEKEKELKEEIKLLKEKEIEEAKKEAQEEVKEIKEAKEEIIDEREQADDVPVQDFGLSDDDEILTAISNAASKSDEELAKLNKNNVRDIKKDDVIREDTVIPKATKKQVKQYSAPLSETLKEIGREETVDIKPVVQEIKQEVQKENSGLSLSEQIKNSVDNKEEKPIKDEVDYNQPLSELIKNNQIPEEKPSYNPYIENPGVDIDVEEYEEDEEREKYEPNYNQYNEYSSLDDIDEYKIFEEEGNATLESLAALDSFVDKKEQNIKEIEKEEYDENKATYDNISSIFPYLSYDFIKNVYAQKDEIAKDYEENKDIVLLHRCHFKDIDNLHEFVEIIMSHDYSVNVDEKKMIVDVMRKFKNEEGAILSNIYTIANQAGVLNGYYEGYRVI